MRLFRLSTQQADTLRWYWNEAEAIAGLHSNIGAVAEILEMGLFGGHNVGRPCPDMMPDRSERDRRKAWAIHRRIQRMQEEPDGIRHVGVLYRAYGPRHWYPACAEFKPAELGALVEFTPTIAKAMLAEPNIGTRRSAVEIAVKMAKESKNGPAAIRHLAAEASDMLTLASRAYVDAWDERAKLVA